MTLVAGGERFVKIEGPMWVVAEEQGFFDEVDGTSETQRGMVLKKLMRVNEANFHNRSNSYIAAHQVL